jgi:hypothetical protein
VTLDEWGSAAAAELGVDAPSGEDRRLVLDVAREVAHNVVRPGAPLATFLLGYAVARGASITEAAEILVNLARRVDAAGTAD